MPNMDYNPRMSMAPRNSQQSSQQKRKHEDDGDAFMTLPDKEIAGCIVDIGINFTVEDLRKPNPQQIQKVFENFAEILANTRRDFVAPGMRAAAEHMCGDDADRIFTADTRELMGFFITMRKILVECGIKDFTFSDLYKPTHPRLVRIFSYVINLIRFRESQAQVMDEHCNSSERTKSLIEQLHNENQEKQDRLREMQQNRKNVENAIKEREARSQELKTRLLELKKGSERVTERLDRVKGEQSRLKTLLEGKTTTIMNLRVETNKLRPYTEQSPAVLEQSLRDLSANLSADRNEIDRLDKRARALQASCDTFDLLQTDIASLTRLLQDLLGELTREDDESKAAAKTREALTEKTHSVRDVEQQERFLKKQLQKWQDWTEKLRKDADARASNAKQKMESLRATHKELTSERRERGEEVEKRRVRIEQTEKKMADLKEQIEHEVQGTREEYMKMESHIRLYMTEMEQNIQ